MIASYKQNEFEANIKRLWLLAQAGDETAYRDVLIQIAARLRRYLRRRMINLPDDVEDLVQETLLALHLQRGTYDSALPLSAWVTAIAKHKLIDLWRRRGRHENLNDTLDDVDESELVAQHDGYETHKDLEYLLKQLPKVQSQAIMLTKLEGLSFTEASARTGISESALKVQVHRGLKRLSLIIKDH